MTREVHSTIGYSWFVQSHRTKHLQMLILQVATYFLPHLVDLQFQLVIIDFGDVGCLHKLLAANE